VQVVIADTGPVNYLILIGHIDVLPTLFKGIIVPSSVRDELMAGPLPVRSWIDMPPPWIEVRRTLPIHDPTMEHLDPGERDGIALAVELHADLLLMDEREGVLVARSKGIEVTGTLGVLVRAAKRNLVNLADAFNRLKQTNFRYRQETMDMLLHEISGN
jgi:predicted nucleic acid-binding protein